MQRERMTHRRIRWEKLYHVSFFDLEHLVMLQHFCFCCLWRRVHSCRISSVCVPLVGWFCVKEKIRHCFEIHIDFSTAFVRKNL